MKRILLFLVGMELASGLIFGVSAFAACGLTITANNVTVSWDLNYTYQSVNFTITKANNPACSYGIAFTKGGATDYSTRRATVGGKTVRYQLYSDAAQTLILKDLPDVLSNNDVIMDSFPEGTGLQHILQYYVQIPYTEATNPNLVAKGAYTDSYTLNVYEGATATAWTTPVTSAAVTLTVNAPYIIALSLVSSGGTFDPAQTSKNLNFGTVSPGQSLGFDIRVRTNAGYSVTFSSANNGNMKLSGGSATVPYKLYVNSVLLNMSNSLAVPVVGLASGGQTGLSGHAYPISAVIAPFAGGERIAGAYSDQITVTTTTTE